MILDDHEIIVLLGGSRNHLEGVRDMTIIGPMAEAEDAFDWRGWRESTMRG